MASIFKRNKSYAVIYYAYDEFGKRKQKWETYPTLREAQLRKKKVEVMQTEGKILSPNKKTLKDFLEQYVSLYGTNRWAPSTYSGNLSIINIYINPIIGSVNLGDIDTFFIDKFYQRLIKGDPNSKVVSEPVDIKRMQHIHKLLRCAFNCAVKWRLLEYNPVVNSTLPKVSDSTREIWNVDTLHSALDACDDPILSLAINLAFSCSLRMGELLGLTWDCVDIKPKSVANNSAYIYVNKELQRVSKQALEKTGEKDLIRKFPAIYVENSTVLIMKSPKTSSSVRKVFLPKAVAKMLSQRKEEIRHLKAKYKNEFTDYNLVICHNNGRPMEGSTINNAFHRLIEENDLPKVVFHSLRHTSTTYKLKISGGDIKATQGDTGHSQAKMVTDRYAHIWDEDRKVNAEKMQRYFYEGEKMPEIGKESFTKEELVESLLKSPQLKELFFSLINNESV